MPYLDYTAVTSGGRALDIRFPLHPETQAHSHVSDMLSNTLDAINAEVQGGQEISDGDVLQALAMALAVRARMIDAPPATCLRLMHELVDGAYAAALQAKVYSAARA